MKRRFLALFAAVWLTSSAPASSSVQIQVPATLPASKPFKVCVAGLPGNPQDWLTVVPANAGASTYAEWAYSNGQRSFCRTFAALEQPGQYEVRVYFNWPKGSYKIQARMGFKAGR